LIDTVSLTLAHWIYLLGVVAIVVTMIFRTTVVVPAVAATFIVAWAYSGSLVTALTSVFNASLVAARELFSIFLIIALMTALLGSLRRLGADVRMVMPFEHVMINGHIAFAVLALVTYLISLFFWPTPAVPLVGAILIPAAVVAGLPAMGALVAVAIAGQGMALSSDYIIQVAPGISARAAGVDIAMVADRAFVLSVLTGAIALALGYLAIRKHIVRPDPGHLAFWEDGKTLVEPEQLEEPGTRRGSFPDKSKLATRTQATPPKDVVPDAGEQRFRLDGEGASGCVQASPEGEGAGEVARPSLPAARERWSKLFAVLIPLTFAAIIVYMMLAKFSAVVPQIQGGEGAALVGGVASVILLFSTLAGAGKDFMTAASDHVTNGLVFAFRAMGSVLPIAGFFFIGSGETAGFILSLDEGAPQPGFLFDLVRASSSAIPESPLLVAFGLLFLGMITGADGSGFSGLPLTGALAGALGQTVGIDPATLAAIGQMGAVWTGGGTLVPWSSLVAVAGFARVPVLEAVRVLFLPVMTGLVVSTLAAVIFL
jgi:hypothetical protein